MDVRAETHIIHSWYATGYEKYWCHLPGSEEHLLIYQGRQLWDDKQAPSVLVNFKLIVRCFCKLFVECSRSILYLSLLNYSTVTMVKTSIYDVNAKCAADAYSKFLLWVYLQVRIILCTLILFLNELDIYWVETRNKMIIWKHSSSDNNIKSKFVSVVIPLRKWYYIFYTVYYKTLLLLYHRLLCSRPNAQIKIQNLLQILLAFTFQVFIYIYK